MSIRTRTKPGAGRPSSKLEAGEPSAAKRRLGLALFGLAALFILFALLAPGKPQEGRARRGEFDASGIGRSTLPLAGEWALLEDSQAAKDGTGPGYATLPMKWARPFGYATYRLRIRGLDPETRYALRVTAMDTSYRLSADGRLLLSGGTPGRSEETTRSAYNTGVAELPSRAQVVDLVLEVANYVHMRGGPFQDIVFGEESEIRRVESFSLISDAVTIGILAIIACFAFMTAAIRNNRSSLFYGLMCLVSSAGIFMLSPDFPIFRLFPGLDWGVYVRLAFIIGYQFPLWLLLTAWSLFGGISGRRMAILSSPLLLQSGLVLALPPRLFTSLDPCFQAYALLLYLFAAALCWRAILKSYPFAKTLSLGFLINFCTVLSVFLYVDSRIHSGEFFALSFLYPLAERLFVSRWTLDIASYVFALVEINAFSLIFFIDASKQGKVSVSMAQAEVRERVREKCKSLGISPREVEVAILALEGKRNREIGETLFISENTVKTHMSNIYAKAGLKARSELFAYFGN